MKEKINELFLYLKIWDSTLKLEFEHNSLKYPIFMSENVLLKLKISTIIEIENINITNSKKGIGRDIILTLVYFSKKFNLKCLRANNVFKESIKFWEKLNFRKIGTNTWQLDINTISLLPDFTKKFT